MKNAFPIEAPRLRTYITAVLFAVFSFLFATTSRAQAVTEVITDYNGYWKSSAASPNAVKPDNANNLLAFSYNGIRYSTGANDNLLASKGQSFVAGDFWSLPVSGMTGTITGNTKVGLGAMYDGVYNGASNPPPAWGIERYLTDGVKGLGLGTCIANLPVGSMSFRIDAINPASIGDGVPDILVTQVADPTGNSYDRYQFTDAAGNGVGNYKDIVFTNITPVGNWTADFYEAANNPLTLAGGFTQTDRPIRLWAADLSDLGITAANYQQIRNFKINLCGNSDVAFVAYNGQSMNFTRLLPVSYTSFTATLTNSKATLVWRTVSEQGADRFVIERSTDGAQHFTAIDSVKATANASVNNYRYTDALSLIGKTYYRLKEVDKKGGYSYSTTLAVDAAGNAKETVLQVYPNPASDKLFVLHKGAAAGAKIIVSNVAGMPVLQQAVAANASQTKLAVNNLQAGTYFLSFVDALQTTTTQFVVR